MKRLFSLIIVVVLFFVTVLPASAYTWPGDEVTAHVFQRQDGSKAVFVQYEGHGTDPAAYAKFMASGPLEIADWGSPCWHDNGAENIVICQLEKNPVNGYYLAAVTIELEADVIVYVRLTWADTRMLERDFSIPVSSEAQVVYTPTPEVTATVTPTVKVTAEPTSTPTPESTPEPTVSVTNTVEATAEPTEEWTPFPVETPDPESTPTVTVTVTAEPTTELPVETPPVIVTIIPPVATPQPPTATPTPEAPTLEPQDPTGLDQEPQPTPVLGEGPVVPQRFELHLPVLAR